MSVRIPASTSTWGSLKLFKRVMGWVGWRPVSSQITKVLRIIWLILWGSGRNKWIRRVPSRCWNRWWSLHLQISNHLQICKNLNLVLACYKLETFRRELLIQLGTQLATCCVWLRTKTFSWKPNKTLCKLTTARSKLIGFLKCKTTIIHLCNWHSQHPL